jgi:tRNA threonylcarbamoyladenosine biosynthesis protein TsaB
MKILSLDTTMAACSAAVVDTQHSLPLAAAYQTMERGHAEALAPMVADVLDKSGVSITEIQRIAVTNGPGSFTGVRIGLSFARGIGLACGIPVIGIDSLSAIAAGFAPNTPLLVASDARNGDVFAASFDAERRLVSGPRSITAANAAKDAEPDSQVIGTAKDIVIAASCRDDLHRVAAEDLPRAAHFAQLAASAIPQGMPEPLYLRAPDAKPQSSPLKAPSYGIEEVTATAAPLLAAIHSESDKEGWSASSFEELMRMPGAATLIAVARGMPEAFLLTRKAADEAEIIMIATRPSARRTGAARKLLTRQLAQLAGQGVRQVFLEVAASNTAAQRLYQAMGFLETGRRRGYYQHRTAKEDAIIMRWESPA